MDSAISVLLVEPDPAVLEPLLEGGRRPRFDVTRTHSRSEALRELERRDYDVVLVDLGAEGARGLAVLRHPAPHARPPIVAVLDSPDLRQALAAVQGGACDVLVRGELSAAGLARALREAARRKRLSSALAAAKGGTDAGGIRDTGSFLEAVSTTLTQAPEGGTIVLLLRPRWEGIFAGGPRGWRDARLQQLAAGLRGVLDERHEVARMDQGCLGVLLRDPGTPEQAAALVRQAREQLTAAETGAGRVGIGVAVHPRDGRTGPELIDAADRALWLFEKISGGGHSPAPRVRPLTHYPSAAGLPAAETLELPGEHHP
ncbi:MAG TPA: response regulator [Thermoanaerobaculia bacterium]|nr:response regulator [Thermoanaerobaculia bacterium]